MMDIESFVSFCKRRGFVYQNSEIYGGFAGFYDYGPIGVEILRNIKNEWWNSLIHQNEEIVGIEGTLITHPKVWKASGHTDEFIDYISECKKCGQSFRADHLILDKTGKKVEGMKSSDLNGLIKKENIKCPTCKGELKNSVEFNLMFKTQIGPGKGETSYLRPETAQLIYLNFKNILDTTRLKIPFGIAQIGKAFRNEISPRNFLFRMREFQQMEMQYFISEKDADKYFEKWKKYRLKWYKEIGINNKKIRTVEHTKEELAHYAKKAIDIEYKFDFGWKEIEGVHNRGDWDLKQHQKFSNQKLDYFDEKTKKRYIPWIIETSAGLDRIFLAVLMDSYKEETVKGRKRIVLKLHPKIAPYKAAVFPLVKKDGLPKKAKEIYKKIKECFPAFYDEKGSIGKMYRRMDEIGTCYCVTVDHQTLEDNTVTIRERDTMKQKRIDVENIIKEIYKNLYS